MLSLTHSPADEFSYKGKIYKVDLSFNRVLLFLEMEQDKTLSPLEKFQQACKLFFHQNDVLPADSEFYEKAFAQISKEITDSPYGTKVNNEKESVDVTKQFDYKRDAGAIYASFFSQYGIDLNKERDKMHWTIFKALLDGLGPKTYFQRILAIRAEDPKKVTDETAKQELLDAQNYYAVDGSKSEKERQRQAFKDPALADMFRSLYNNAKENNEKGGK